MALAGGSILERIFQVFAHSARLTLLHLPGGNRLPNWATALTPTRMAVNDAAIGDDYVTRSRCPGTDDEPDAACRASYRRYAASIV